MFISDPDIFYHPESYIKREVQNKRIFLLPDQIITVPGTGTVVNVHAKFNFSPFSKFLKGINFKIYKFHYQYRYFKFNFSHV
jgi:hypothetical protein